MCLIQGTSMALTVLCVVMLIGAQTQQHKLILLLQTESEREKKETLWKIHSALWWTSGIPLTEQQGGRERKHASSNCVCWLGGYMIDRASRVLVIIPLRTSRGSRTDLIVITGIHRRHTWAQSPILHRQAGVKLRKREPHTSRCSMCSFCTCSSLSWSFFWYMCFFWGTAVHGTLLDCWIDLQSQEGDHRQKKTIVLSAQPEPVTSMLALNGSIDWRWS